MANKKKIVNINEVLDEKLAEIGFSSKTKSLRTYAISGITQRIKVFYVGFKKIDEMKEDALPVALFVTNRFWNNGASREYWVFKGNKVSYYPKKEIKTHIQNTEIDKERSLQLYRKMRLSTLKKWRKAIKIIDDLKG